MAIDRERASDLGINITGLAEALQAMLDGHEVGQVFIEDRSYEVKLVSTTNPINDPTDLENIFLKTADGRFVPVVDDRHAHRGRGAAVAVARTADARRRRSPRAWRPTSRSARR